MPNSGDAYVEAIGVAHSIPPPQPLHFHSRTGHSPFPQEKGSVVFSSPTSSTSISGDLTLTEDGLVVFPPPSVHASLVLAGGGGVEAEAPWGPGEGDLDGGGGWGAASRSSLMVEGKFVWGGGAISGNARVRTPFVQCSRAFSESKWATTAEER